MAGENSGAGVNRVLPLMQEAVLMVRMILHRRLAGDFAAQLPDLEAADRGRLAGALVNNLFGTAPEDDRIAAFARAERPLVEAELRGLASRLGDLRPLLTDALRMHCICEDQEGRSAGASLLLAQALGLLDADRPAPMPSTFMLAVRKRAVAEGLVRAMDPAEDLQEQGLSRTGLG